MIQIIEFIIVFGLFIFLHEFGHFIVAKILKMKVDEFGFGFPPRLVKLFSFGETEVTLNWIPFGAFVRLHGENDPEIKDGFEDTSPWARFAVLLGGPALNLLTGIVLFAMIFIQLGVPNEKLVSVYQVSENSPAQAAGLQINDVFVSVNGINIDSISVAQQVIRENAGKQIDIIVNRNGEDIVLLATPRENPPAGESYLGVGITNPYREATFFEAIPYAARVTYEQARMLFLIPGMLARGEITAEQARPVGPLGIYGIYSQAREMDESNAGSTSPSDTLNTLSIFATISVALGLTNLLPIPALDGGRILFILPEIFIRKKIPAKYENAINLISFAALLLLMVFITTLDITNPVVIP